MKVEMIKYPTEEDWHFCKECTLNTVGKKTVVNEPDRQWKHKMLASEHSPIRTLWFAFRLEIPYWVSVHLVRHKIGVEHFVSTQRSDRTGEDRNEKTQDAIVSHIIYINAQELMNMAHKRLCKCASPETQEVVREMSDLVQKQCPEFEWLLVPNCVYRGGKCDEMFSCRSNK